MSVALDIWFDQWKKQYAKQSQLKECKNNHKPTWFVGVLSPVKALCDAEKNYKSKKVEDERKKLWEENFKMVEQHNKEYLAGTHSYRIRQTWCGDQTIEELSRLSCQLPPVAARAAGGSGKPNRNEPDEPASAININSNPETVDWRKKECVTEVKDQGHTSFCWIFSAMSAVESHNAITNGELVTLSVQQLVDCIGSGDVAGYVSRAFDYIVQHGSILESEYTQRDLLKIGNCESDGKQLAVRIEGWVQVGKSEQQLETAVAQKGPVAVTLWFSNADQFSKFKRKANYEDDVFYDTGKHDNKANQKYCHAVLVVGYGFQFRNGKKEKYWIIKNSWGYKEGEENSGYHKVAKDRGNNCCIASCAMYPVVRKV